MARLRKHMLSLDGPSQAQKGQRKENKQIARGNISWRKVQNGRIKRRKVAIFRRATEQMSGNRPLYYCSNTLMRFLYTTLWKDKPSFTPNYRYCHKIRCLR